MVHGASLGGWTWYKVSSKLKSGGHKVTSLDMAASGINPEQVKDVHSIVDYSKPLMEFMEALPSDERVILVGHSHGGACISLAMEKYRHKIAVAVFIAAFMPCLGLDMDSIYEEYHRPLDFYMDCTYQFEDGKLVSTLFGPQYMSEKLFQKCPPEDLELALALIRPLPGSASPEPLEKDDPKLLTEENYGSVRRIYVKLGNDELINRPVETFRLENYPPEEVKIIYKADHMAMLSNPQDLSSYFQEISQKYY